jgi:hypothetical protein
MVCRPVRVVCHPACMYALQLGLLTTAEAEGVIALEFNPVRVGFHGGAGEAWRRPQHKTSSRPKTCYNSLTPAVQSTQHADTLLMHWHRPSMCFVPHGRFMLSLRHVVVCCAVQMCGRVMCSTWA